MENTVEMCVVLRLLADTLTLSTAYSYCNQTILRSVLVGYIAATADFLTI